MSDDMWADAPSADDAEPKELFARPQDVLSERALAASVMEKPDLIDELADDVDLIDFSTDWLAWVWRAVDELRQTTEGPIPWFAVGKQLRAWRESGYLPIVPPSDTDLSLLYQEAFPAQAQWHAERVAKAAVACRLVELGIRAQQVGMSAGFDGAVDLSRIQAALDEVMPADGGGGAAKVGDLVDDALERAVTPPDKSDRVTTGFMDLDSLTGGGFRPGRLVIIGARPGVGKSTIGAGFARAAAITAGLPSLFISLEMDREEIMEGILSAEARVARHHITTGEVDADGIRKLTASRQRIADAPLWIDDTSHVSIPSLRNQIRTLVRTVGLRCVVVDYLQLMQAPRAESRQVAVSMMSRQLKLMAKEFGIVLIVLSQLNRASEQRADKTPTIADLRESGAIEQDADMVILIHRPDMHEPESPRAGEVDLIVDKHRGGPRARITAAWQGHYARIVDMAADPFESRPMDTSGAVGVQTWDDDEGEAA